MTRHLDRAVDRAPGRPHAVAPSGVSVRPRAVAPSGVSAGVRAVARSGVSVGAVARSVSSAGRRRGLRRLLATALAGVVTASVLAGCASGGAAPTAPAASGTASTPGESIDPRAITGPSTAETVADVTPLSPAPQPGLPATVTDERGVSVTVRDIRRMLALDVYGTLAETVVSLGLGDNLVGRGSSNTLASMASLPVVTQNGHDLNAEAILALSPTVILTDTTIGPAAVREQLEASGITVVYFSPKRELATVPARIAAVADALGVPEAGEALAKRVKGELADARERIAELAPDPGMRMAFLYVRGTAGIFFVFGRGEGADDLIDALGGVDVASRAGIEGIKPANAEALLATDPEVILVMTDGLASTGGVDGLLARPGVADTTAGQHRRIVDMADGQVLAFGPSSAAVLLSLANAIYRPGAS